MPGLAAAARAQTLMKAYEERGKYTVSGGGDDTIDLNRGHTGFVTPEHIREAAVKAIRDGHTHYEDVPELREAIADKLAVDNDIRVDPVRGLVVGGGAHLVFFDLMQTYVDPGDEVIVPRPGQPTYYHYNTILNGGEPVYVPLRRKRRFKLDPDDVEAAITPRTKLIGLTNPDTPTGALHAPEDHVRIAELAMRHDLLIVSDETYEKINYGSTPHSSIASLPGMAERTITINSFSKAYAMTGWRVGYAAGPPELIQPLQAMHATNCIWLSTPSQYAALAAYRGPQEPVAEMVAEYERRMRRLVDGLQAIEGVDCLMPEGAYYAWPSVEGLGLDGHDFAVAALERGRVRVGLGEAFGPKAGEHSLRMSCSPTVDEIEEGLRRLAKVSAELRDGAA